MSADLIFTHEPTGSDLVFGAQESVTQGSTVTVQIRTETRLHVFVGPKRLATAQIKAPAAVMNVVAEYDVNVDRPTAGQASTRHHEGTPVSAQNTPSWHDGTGIRVPARANWTEGQGVRQSLQGAWRDGDRTKRTATAAAWQDGRSGGARPVQGVWQDGDRTKRTAIAAAWQDGQGRRAQAAAAFQDGDRTKRTQIGNTWQVGKKISKQVSRTVQCGTHLVIVLGLGWQDGHVPTPGKWVPDTETEPTTGRTPDANLVFERPAGSAGELVFNWSVAASIIPEQKVYIVKNEVTLTRTDTSVSVVPLSLSISIDSGSWAHSWSADVAYDQWAALNATYTSTDRALEMLATVNGHQWLLLAEGAPQRSRAFGQTTVRISGRCVSAWLDTPYADESDYYNDDDMTAQQLMAYALTTNGVSLGWDLDWQITDWTVPAGLWSFSGSPIAGVLDVAESIKAIIQADPYDKILHVLPYYPSAPWDWSSQEADVQIPTSIMLSDSLTPSVKSVYNRVFVSGTSQGVLAQVTRTGTAGDKIAAMVTHALITESAAGRQRGLAILGDTGHQATVQITLPISDDTGLMEVGQLAYFPEDGDEWWGLIRGVSVSAQWSDSLKVNQTLEVERHYESD